MATVSEACSTYKRSNQMTEQKGVSGYADRQSHHQGGQGLSWLERTAAEHLQFFRLWRRLDRKRRTTMKVAEGTNTSDFSLQRTPGGNVCAYIHKGTIATAVANMKAVCPAADAKPPIRIRANAMNAFSNGFQSGTRRPRLSGHKPKARWILLPLAPLDATTGLDETSFFAKVPEHPAEDASASVLGTSWHDECCRSRTWSPTDTTAAPAASYIPPSFQSKPRKMFLSWSPIPV